MTLIRLVQEPISGLLPASPVVTIALAGHVSSSTPKDIVPPLTGLSQASIGGDAYSHFSRPFLVVPDGKSLLHPTKKDLQTRPAPLSLPQDMGTQSVVSLPPHMPFTQEQWAILAVKQPDLIQRFMLDPLNQVTLRQLINAANYWGGRADDLIHGAENFVVSQSGIYDLSHVQNRAIREFFNSGVVTEQSTLRIVFNPKTNVYQVVWHDRPEDSPVDDLFTGAWRFSTLAEQETGAKAIAAALIDPAIVDQVENGARVLILPQSTDIAVPQLIGLSRSKKEGPARVQFWFPKGEQTEQRGSAVSLVLPKSRERFDSEKLIQSLVTEAKRAAKNGKRPALALDLDGTLFDARQLCIDLFWEWLEAYDGPDKEEIQHKANQQTNLRAWDLEGILKERLGIDREETIASANEKMKSFYMPDTKVNTPPITATVDIIKEAQRRLALEGIGLVKVFVTLRDIKKDTMSDGSEATLEALKRQGLWDENSYLMRHDGKPIEWRKADMLAKAAQGIKNEPDKWEMVQKFRKGNKNIFFVGVVDNDTNHLEGYAGYFGHTVVSIFVLGDLPPTSPAFPREGVFVVDPYELVQLEQGAAK